MIVTKLQEALRQLQIAKLRYEMELEGIAEGRLQYIKATGQYNVRLKEEGRAVRRGITKQPVLIKELARKEFLLRALPVVERNCAVIEQALDAYEPCDPAAIIARLSATYRAIPEELFFDPLADVVCFALDAEEAERVASHREWGEEPYAPAEYRPEARTVITSRGERMRSKAEVLIAEKLYEYGISFRYEQELVVGEATFFPDFTFEGAGGRPVYLEFCGMMDDPGYVTAHKRKAAAYERAGIVPWENIIYLYAKGNDLDMRRVDAMIRTQLVPWL